jgi:hypothetical protein
MKKLVLAVVFVGGLAAGTFASLNSTKKNVKQEKKTEKQEKKKECKHYCPFS